MRSRVVVLKERVTVCKFSKKEIRSKCKHEQRPAQPDTLARQLAHWHRRFPVLHPAPLSSCPSTASMSSKRKWDQAAPSEADSPVKAVKVEDGKTASEAAAAAAAIAAKIAAQFAGPAGAGISLGPKDPHDGDYIRDIDINDVRNRYLLTKGSTQTQVRSSFTNVAMRAKHASTFDRYTRKLGLQ